MALKLNEGIKGGLSEKDAWDTYAGISLCDAGIAHSVLTIHTSFLQMIEKIKEPKLKAVMTKLCILFGVEKLIERSSRVYETGILTPDSFKLLSKKR